MRIEDRRSEFLNTAARTVDGQTISEAERQLAAYLSALEDVEDLDLQQKYKREIARKGLQIEQQLIPRLQGLATKMLDGVGGKVIRDVCEPIQRLDRNGRPETFCWTGKVMPPIQSGYRVPERYKQSKVGSVVDAVLGK